MRVRPKSASQLLLGVVLAMFLLGCGAELPNPAPESSSVEPTTAAVVEPEPEMPVADARVDAVVTTELSCPEGSEGEPTEAEPVCSSETVDEVSSIVDEQISFGCPDGSSGAPDTSAPLCDVLKSVPAAVATTYSCPADSAGNPTAGSPVCERTVVADVPVIVTERLTCGGIGSPFIQADPTQEPTEAFPFCIERPGVIISCPDQRQYCGQPPPEPERLVPAVVVESYACPEDSEAPDGDLTSDSTCSQTQVVTIEALSSSSYSCPSGAAGSPSGANPTCTTESTIEATQYVTMVHRCPEGATGTPTDDRPTCSRVSTSKVPAQADTSYSCPAGSAGSPTADDLFCTKN